MSAQQENLMEELVNRDFILTTNEPDVVVYEKETREGSETVTIFMTSDFSLHERWNTSGILTSAERYSSFRPADTMRLLASIH